MSLLALAVALVQRIKQGAVDENTGIQHGGWPDEEPADHASESEADELRGQAKQELVPDAPALVEVHALSRDNVGCVSSAGDNVGHNSDQSMFLYVERTRVERPSMSECRETGTRKNTFQDLAAW